MSPREANAGVPDDLRSELELEIGPIEHCQPIGGGSISAARRIESGSGTLFLKFDRAAPDGFFAVEAAGLRTLSAATPAIRIPQVVGYRDEPAGWSWLALEWLEPSPRRDDFGEALGLGLASLHRNRADRWGWHRAGFIGRLPQANGPTASWAEFWYGARIGPQLDRAAARANVGSPDEWARFRALLPTLLDPAAEEDGPSLLHGDLWSGNVIAMHDGPALVDPSAYYGHREVDLAMAELFGGFERSFFDGYAAEWDLLPGYALRRKVYQLYYLLVHVNLFGASYAPTTAETLRRILAEAEG